MNGNVNPLMQVVNVGDEWNGRPARVGRSVNRNWVYQVRILGDDRNLVDASAGDVRRIAERTLDRLGDFRGHAVAEVNDYHDALAWFEDAKESGEIDDFDEGLYNLYNWGDSERVVIS